VDVNLPRIRIDDPVIVDAASLVGAPFERFVAPARAGRQDLDNQVRHTLDVLRREGLQRALVRQVEQIRLDDVNAREDHIERRIEQLANRVCAKVVADGQGQAS
jgi:hypothetical protein